MARKEKQYHFIYKTTNLLNNKYYYGMHSTDDLNDGYMGSGKRLRYSINKYGKENHKVEILEFLPNRKALIEKEKEVVNLNEIAKEDCMNLMVGGEGGFISTEQQKHRSSCGGKSTAMKLKTNVEYYRKHSELSSITIKKTHKLGKIKYDTFTGKHHTEKTKELMKKSKIGYGIGKNNSQFGTCWICKNEINKKIKLNELNSYIELGWTRGRIINPKDK